MKTNVLLPAWLFTSILLVSGSPIQAQVPKTSFRAGAYRGTLTLTTSIDDVAETTATLKVKGRSTGDSTLRFMGVPQLAQPVLLSGDDFPVKLFILGYNDTTQRMTLTELVNVDAPGAIVGGGLDSLTVNGNVVRAEMKYNVVLGSITIDFRLRVRLTRVGN
jgi:hypothetical protein